MNLSTLSSCMRRIITSTRIYQPQPWNWTLTFHSHGFTTVHQNPLKRHSHMPSTTKTRTPTSHIFINTSGSPSKFLHFNFFNSGTVANCSSHTPSQQLQQVSEISALECSKINNDSEDKNKIKMSSSPVNVNVETHRIQNIQIQIQTPQSAVIRYSPTDERFQLKLTHRGKIFNFDRSVEDSVETLLDRISTNVGKKIKTWNGTISLLLSNADSNSNPNTWNELSDSDKLAPTKHVLQQLLQGCRLNIRVAEDVYSVSVNPPEVFSIKFLKQSIVGFPLIPYKVETSGNFLQSLSKYSWEFTMEKKKHQVPQKKRKNSVGDDKTGEAEGWMDTGCRDFIFTPTKEHIGARLRVTCVPSDGLYFGLPFIEECPETVVEFPVANPFYQERLSRIRITERKSDSNFFRVVSYNCLADCYATPEWFISSPKESLVPDFRLPFLCRELLEYQSDIYCLQEVDAKYFEKIISPFLKQTLDFDGLFSCKTGNMKEGVATFYNPKKLELIKNETIPVVEHMKTLPFWNDLNGQKISETFSASLEERNTVLQLSIFRPECRENTILIIANTHLYFHPDADHIRLLQTITCVDYIEIVAKSIQEEFRGFDVSVLFCGDFNCTPPFSSYRFLTSGRIEEDDFDWTSHPIDKITGISRQHGLEFKNAHPTEQLTNITTCFEGCLDYILYQPKSFQLLNSYPPPTKEFLASAMDLEETRHVSLPNFHTPSDHLPIIADFLLKT